MPEREHFVTRVSPEEFRTPPRKDQPHRPPCLHEARAQTIYDAIVMPDGEAARAAAAYQHLPMLGRQTLHRFVKSR